MISEYEDIDFEEPSFVENMDPNMKLLLETFMMLDEKKMVVVLKQFYKIVKLLKQNIKSKKETEPDNLSYVGKLDSMETSSDDKDEETIAVETDPIYDTDLTIQQAKQTIELVNTNECDMRKIKKEYTCDFCREIFKNKNVLKRHMRIVHSVKEEEFYPPKKCENHCERVFTKISAFLRHKQCFKEMTICPTCGKSIPKQKLGLHLFNQHTARPIPCEICDYKFQNKELLEEHIKKSHEGPGYQCEFCEFWHQKMGSLNLHIKTEHEGFRLQCNECDFETKAKNNLETHVAAVHRNRTFDCRLCEYSCKDKRFLLKHEKSFHDQL